MTKTSSGANAAQNIEKVRIERGRTVIWLAAKTAMAEKTLRRRLVAPGNFTLAELSAIATALDSSLEAMIANSEPTQSREIAA